VRRRQNFRYEQSERLQLDKKTTNKTPKNQQVFNGRYELDELYWFVEKNAKTETRENWTRYYEKYSLFREDIDGAAIVRYIVWLSDAYQNDVTERVKRGEFRTNDADTLSAEWQKFYDFMSDLRKIFYKEGV